MYVKTWINIKIQNKHFWRIFLFKIMILIDKFDVKQYYFD